MHIVECRALLFDFDGVLVDSSKLIYRLWSSWATKQNLDPEQVCRGVHGRRAYEIISSIAPHLPAKEEAQTLTLEEESNPSGTEQVPGAAELLAALPEDCWAIVTSSGRAATLSKLMHAGLTPPKTLVSADDVLIGKPDPEGYLKAAELLDKSPLDCIVIEDSPAGLEAANKAGMRSIGVLSTHESSELTNATFLVERISNILIKHIVNEEITLTL
jgi:mannitol-1-/sugar-/sorbitol-6-phosphatase